MKRISVVTDRGWDVEGSIDDAVIRIADIEDILGDDYDPDRLKEIGGAAG